ncbi:C-N hydrolase family amidase [Stieleria neptunia]|uniref:C-N hydrolase family amidase n=1 Tax=Stieleria neptunia TaxID=2527979 RepID=A0A518HSU7_9BACT|nr:carbon-nitrogen hydrolase family protein [Stieleria neptunia]QDV43912.1 C-N hydrolase family amidase [Stieleria neptunia]
MSSERSRRRFVGESFGVLTATAFGAKSDHAWAGPLDKKRVAAVQMHADLGDVNANMRKASRLANKAVDQGAKVVVLPEFFTSGLGFHPAVLNASRPIDGAPQKMLLDVARRGVWVGGSFLAESGGHVYNTFMLALPDGRVFTHDKDFPTGAVEQHLYAGGDDEQFVSLLKRNGQHPLQPPVPSRSDNNPDGVFRVGNTCVGAAMCWELVRKNTDRRLLKGRVDLILGASGWYGLEPKSAVDALGGTENSWTKNLEQGRAEVSEAPSRLAKMTGAAVIHSNLVGNNWAPRFPSGQKQICRQFYGESQIVERDGTVIQKLSGDAGEGVVVDEITPERIEPPMAIGDGFWHIDMTPQLQAFWYDSFGRDYYLKVTCPQRELMRRRQP